MTKGTFNLEYWDLFNDKGLHLQKIHKRGIALNPGEYHMVVSNWIRNKTGEYLIQKRTKPLRGHPNPWSCTAGAAIKGESSIEAVIRETKEEMGIKFTNSDLIQMECTFFDDFFMVVYESAWNGESELLSYDPEEVAEVKWVKRSEIIEMYHSEDFFDHETEYFKRLLNAADNCVMSTSTEFPWSRAAADKISSVTLKRI